MTTYLNMCHLGESTREDDRDQRLSRDTEGNFYLFDWSGSSPERTDDGPLRINIHKPMLVGETYVRVPLLDQNGRECWTGVTHKGLARLLPLVFRCHAPEGEDYMLNARPDVVFEDRAGDIAAIAKITGAA